MRLSASAVTLVLGELRKLESRGAMLWQGGRAFIKCPFHGGGQERTPSCLVTARVDSKYEIGSYRCMGCGAYGKWNDLAEALGLEQVNADANVAKTVFEYGKDVFDSMWRERYLNYAGLLEDLELTNPRPPADDFVWRTIPGDMLKKVKAVMVDGRFDALLLPAYMHGELVGGIRALMQDPGDKTVVKYKNSSGEWSRAKGLYPFDLCSKMMDDFEQEYGFRGLCLVEGARDSLVLCCEGMPTLGLLGTQSWCAGKFDNITDLDPDFVLLVMDGDAAGREAEQKIWEEVRKLLPCRKMNMSRFNKEVSAERGRKVEVDPGNAPQWVIEEIWKQLHKRKPSTRS